MIRGSRLPIGRLAGGKSLLRIDGRLRPSRRCQILAPQTDRAWIMNDLERQRVSVLRESIGARHA